LKNDENRRKMTVWKELANVWKIMVDGKQGKENIQNLEWPKLLLEHG